jgi:transcriptional regulator with XRE-family HTH domain
VPKAPRHPILRRLGTRVRELRQQRGLSQEAFADVCRIDRSYMSGIERGVRNISVLHLARLAKGLGISIADLFTE